MRKTPFAGLTELAPAEPLSTDGSSFQSRNPTLIDRFLELGAVSHRHDARPAMPNPEDPPSGSAYTVGGALPADLTLFVGYTVNDGHGGETALSEPGVFTTDPAMEEPIGAPDATIEYGAGGDLSTAVYYYAITLTDGEGGETPIGPYIDVERVPGEASARTLLSGMGDLAASALADGWKLYRSTNGGDYHYLTSGATAVNDYIDDGADCVDCVPPPTTNTTNQTNRITVELPASGALPSGFTGINVYMSPDGIFRSPSLYAAMPSASAGATFDVLGLGFSDGAPPDVSTAVRGASQIDPDSEILDWHWKRPVASAAALPSGAEQGDVRVTLDDGAAHVFVGSAWGLLAGGGGGGGGGSTIPMGSAFAWESTRDGSTPIRMVGHEEITSDFMYESNSDLDIADYNAENMTSSGGALFNSGASLAGSNAWAFASATQTFDDTIGDNFYAEAAFDPMSLDVEGAGVILGSAYVDSGAHGPQGLIAVYEPGEERFSIVSRGVITDFAIGNILASATAASGSIAASGCAIGIQRYNDEITAFIYSPEWTDAINLAYTVPEADRPYMRDRFQYQAGVYGRATATGDIVVTYLHFERTRLGRRLDIEIDDGEGLFATTQLFSFNGKRGTPAGEDYRYNPPRSPVPGDGVTMIDAWAGTALVYVEGTRAYMDSTVFDASGAASAASGVLFTGLPGASEAASINVIDDNGDVQRLRWQGDGTLIRETAGSGVIRISGMSVRHGPLQP